ncbi:MAG: restriction endonuclease subunit S [Magnetococcales bacterium]|nr:restriction endonuclease subunit S [Magnetococcales bacterium]
MTPETFFQHFEQFADTPNAVAKMRELILQLAVQGKLVPQDPNDEPASVLLERIQVEKERLIKEKKIRRGKKLPPIDLDEVPFEVPEGWINSRLGELVELEYGKSLPAKTRTESGEYSVFGSNGIVGTHNQFLVEEPAIIIGRKGSAGALNKANGSFWPTDVTYYVVPPAGIDLNYCYLLLKSLKLDELGKGIKPGLNRSEAYNLMTGLPPLAEQKHIVAKVDQLMSICDQLEAQRDARRKTQIQLNQSALNSLTTAPDQPSFNNAWTRIRDHFDLLYDHPQTVAQLRQTILQLAVMGKLVPQDPNDEPASVLLERIKVEKERLIKEKKVRRQKAVQTIDSGDVSIKLPEGWVVSSIGDVILFDIGGGTPSKRNPEYWDGDIPWASVKDVGKAKHLDQTIDKITDLGLDKSSSNLVPAGNLIVCTRMGLGKISINTIDVAINQDLRALFLPTEIDIDHFYNYFLTRHVTGSGMTVKGIKRAELLAMLIPLPPLTEQKRIVTKVDQLMTLCDQLESQSTNARDHGQRLLNATVAGLVAA